VRPFGVRRIVEDAREVLCQLRPARQILAAARPLEIRRSVTEIDARPEKRDHTSFRELADDGSVVPLLLAVGHRPS